MKDKLIARKIRRMIQKNVNNFFENKLNTFNGDIEKLLTNREVVAEIDDYLQSQEEEAIQSLKKEFGIDFHNLSFDLKRSIIRQVEDKIFYV